ncbi:hypothetical protein [uncultured Helicobacter sp.]|uniref:hypothetical protein n=1 Tax=uncultured Helicobacter sp. TaxID=175537 RepID=UPI0026221FBD|nr:hypothetical protein [uncultured Helicobacter sp.]
MARILCLLALGVVLYGNTRYFLYEEAKIAKDTYLEKKQESRDFYIHSSPMFFKPKTHSYKQAVLIYDLYKVASHYNKQFEGRHIVGGLSLNKVYATRMQDGIASRWILGSGAYLNVFNYHGRGALRSMSLTTLSAEIRARIATQFLIDNYHMLELSLQLPIFGVGLFGYSPTKGGNALFLIRFLYGDI